MRPIVWRVPFGESTLLPAGCVHYPLCEKDLLNDYVRALVSAKNGFGILMGDTCDFARTHYRNHIRNYRDDDNSQEAIDEYVRKDVRDLAKILKPVQGRLMGAILGNHFFEFSDGTNSEQYLCQLLKIPYLGPTGLVRLEFVDRAPSVVRHTMTLWAHHSGGAAGGRTSGGDVNAMERAENTFDADIYLLSHTHRRYATRQPILRLSSKGAPRLIERTKVFVRTGAFLKGYKQDMPTTERRYTASYAEQKALRPTDLGWVTVHIKLVDWGSKTLKSGPKCGVQQKIEISY